MQPPNLDSIGKFLGTLAKATFGPGALGRIGTVMIVTALAFSLPAIVLAYTQPLYAIAALVIVALLVGYFLHRAFNFADRNPGYAAMDGAQITRHMMRDVGMTQLSAQEVEILDTVPVENPRLPHLSETEGSDEAV